MYGVEWLQVGTLRTARTVYSGPAGLVGLGGISWSGEDYDLNQAYQAVAEARGRHDAAASLTDGLSEAITDTDKLIRSLVVKPPQSIEDPPEWVMSKIEENMDAIQDMVKEIKGASRSVSLTAQDLQDYPYGALQDSSADEIRNLGYSLVPLAMQLRTLAADAVTSLTVLKQNAAQVGWLEEISTPLPDDNIPLREPPVAPVPAVSKKGGGGLLTAGAVIVVVGTIFYLTTKGT